MLKRVLTKSLLLAARACDERAYRSIILGETGSPNYQGDWANYRATDLALRWVHALRTRGGQVNEDAVPSIWARAWSQAQGKGPPTDEGLAWLGAYVRLDPFLSNGRRILSVEKTFTIRVRGLTFSARPDVLCLAGDGAVEALELTGTKQFLWDAAQQQTLSAIDFLVLHGPDVPEIYRHAPKRVIACSTEEFREVDITPSVEDARAYFEDLERYLNGLQAGQHVAVPTLDGCPTCPFATSCEWSLVPRQSEDIAA